VILVEAALISPPEGVNLYVIHGLRDSQDKGKTIMDVYKGVMPFFLAMIVAIGLVVVFPEICLWLPNTMKGK
jgi:C4-dicarboxylate transporter DctM subunit